MSFLIAIIQSTITWAIVSTTVGQVQNHVVTSREVLIQNLMEQALYGQETKKSADYSLLPVDSQKFSKALSNTLLEWVIYLEAQAFKVVEVSDEDVTKAERKVKDKLSARSEWKSLDVSNQELRDILTRKLYAKKFIRFRADSSVVPISDAEAERYFNENRLKFGSVPFENFKENIKSYLARTQVERRLKDWFEVLQAKYKVKNFLAEI